MLAVCMGQRSTYYTDAEEQALEQLAAERDESFSGIVRKAIHDQYEL